MMQGIDAFKYVYYHKYDTDDDALDKLALL